MTSKDETIASLQEENDALKAKIKSLSSKLGLNDEQPKQQQIISSRRQRIYEMSSEVVESNPYSRLMALKRMGVVKNYEDIRKCSLIIIGIGGIGSVAAEMLTRCGCGKLILIDYDKVELANMNRLFFRPEHAGLTKTRAAVETLKNINPDVEFEDFTYDITSIANYDHFKSLIQNGGVGGGKISLVLSCVDNYAARTTINQACTELDQIWMESGVSEDAVSGHIQTLLPGRTSCFECLPPLIVASGIDESTLKREGVCAASLPTTMGIVAGMLIQNCLKFLLEFGQVSYYLGYSAMTNHFPSEILYPNPECSNLNCREMQKKYGGKWHPQIWKRDDDDQMTSGGPLHEENEWNITIEDDALSNHEEDIMQVSLSNLNEGLRFKYEKPDNNSNDIGIVPEENVVEVDKEASLEDLMAQLKSI